MSSEERPTAELRVGGWLPPFQQTAAGSSALPDTFLASASATVPSSSPAAARPAGTPLARRRPVVVTAAAVAVLGITGAVVYETSGPSNAAGAPTFVTLPSVPTVPAVGVPLPSSAAPAPSLSASLSPSPSVSSSPSPSSPASSPSSPPPSRSASPAPSSASPSPSPSRSTPSAVRRGPFTIGSRTGLEVSGSPGSRVRHRDYRARVDSVSARSSALDKADSTFVARTGLADTDCVSFESVNYPGYYLRHRNGKVYLDRRATTTLYAADATFCVVEGRSGAVTLRSFNYPERFLALDRSGLVLGGRGVALVARTPF